VPTWLLEQAAIVGAPDPRLGEKNCLCVIIKDGTSLALDEVRLWVCLQEVTSSAIFAKPHVSARFTELITEVVKAMAEDAFQPEFRVLEEHSHPIASRIDPMPELLERREVVQEGPGYFVIGPLLARFLGYLEQRLLQVAAEMRASPYRCPALIAPSYMEKVQYFRNFPHSLTFATHLRENLPDIERGFREMARAVRPGAASR